MKKKTCFPVSLAFGCLRYESVVEKNTISLLRAGRSSSSIKVNIPFADQYRPDPLLCVNFYYMPSMQVPTVPLYSSGFSSQSAVETSQRARQRGAISVQSSFQTFQTHNRTRRSKSLCQADQEAITPPVSAPQEKTFLTIPVPPPGTLRRSLSGTLAQDRSYWQEEEVPNQYIYKGPSHRTISRITNRQQHYQQQGSTFGQEGWVGTSRGVPMAGDGFGTQWQQNVCRVNHGVGTGQYQASLNRAASVRSVRSVGKGVDVMDGASIHSNDPLEG